MSAITTHVLDTARGRPAQGVPLLLEVQESGRWKELSRATTNADGRAPDLFPSGTTLAATTYRLRFDTGAYFAAQKMEGFYPEATIVFTIQDPAQHYHVPLLLSPYGYSTYRGS